jgi:GntR family transcriptional regulator
MSEAPEQPVQASGRFAVVPARVLDDRAIRPAALRVLLALATHSNRDGWCWPSIPTIARRLGVLRQAVSRAIGELVHLGYLTVQPQTRANGSRSSNLYRIGPQCLYNAESFDRVIRRGSFSKLDSNILYIARRIVKALADRHCKPRVCLADVAENVRKNRLQG